MNKEIEVGDVVRVTSETYRGQLGVVTALSPQSAAVRMQRTLGFLRDHLELVKMAADHRPGIPDDDQADSVGGEDEHPRDEDGRFLALDQTDDQAELERLRALVAQLEADIEIHWKFREMGQKTIDQLRERVGNLEADRSPAKVNVVIGEGGEGATLVGVYEDQDDALFMAGVYDEDHPWAPQAMTWANMEVHPAGTVGRESAHDQAEPAGSEGES
jgi:hypothetical protein